MAVDCGEQAGELLDVIEVDVPGEEKGFEIIVRLRDGLHGQKMMAMILEDQRRDGVSRGELREISQAEGFAMNTHGVAEPIHLDAQFGEGLLENPCLAIGSLDENSAIGDAAVEDADLWGFVLLNMSLGAQVAEELVWLLDV
jgi:hypothetical protein